MAHGRLADGGRLQMLAVAGTPNADLAAAQPAAPYQVDVGRHRRPAPTFPYTPGETAPTTNDTALNYVGNQGRAQGAACFSRLEGASTTAARLLLLDPGRRPGRAGPQRPVAAATATAPARSGRTTARGAAAAGLPVAGPDTLDFPDNVTTSKRGTLVLCEDNVNDNYLRGLTATGSCSTSRSTGSSAHGRRRQRRVRRRDVQPGRAHAVREHPGQPRDVVRDLGAVAHERRLMSPSLLHLT